ncbi:MAG: hypothetical protein PHR87_10155 [Sulfurospirillaceae bacterium]|nr:hypothetical protein [Sulfurospirillaceae bacterium]
MTNAEMAKRLNIAEKTLYNWKQNRKELFEIVEKALNNNVNIIYESKKTKELVQLIEKLSDKEKDMYILEIKARILKKELGEK